MRRLVWALVGAAVALLLTGATAGANGDGLTLTPDGWAAVRSLTWPGAVVLSMFSPVGKALAGLLLAITPTRASAGTTVVSDTVVGEVLKQMTAAMQRQNEIGTRTVEALQQIEQGLAILLDRTPRAAGQVVNR